MQDDKILKVATDSDLALAVQENLFDLFRAMKALPGYESVEDEALCYHHASPTSPLFKGVWRTRLTPENADAAIDRALDWFQARKAPYLFWWNGPGTEPADLGERLAARGFGVFSAGEQGMAADLRELRDEMHTPDSFRIVQVIDQQGLEDWRDTFVAAYEVPAFAGQAWVDATQAVGPTAAPWKLYVGYLDGKPVATNILFAGAGVAGLYGVGTLAAARRKGIGAAITLKPLLDARAQGYRYGVLFSTELGHPVYRRLGFRDVDCKIGRYLLRRA